MQYHSVFLTFLVQRLFTLREDNNIFTSNIPEEYQVFANKFDELQSSILKVLISNEMLAGVYTHTVMYRIISTCMFLIIGMLTKAKGQILCFATCMHILFLILKILRMRMLFLLSIKSQQK